MFRRRLNLAPELVTVPAGTFLMGSTEEQIAAVAERYQLPLEWLQKEVPQHAVELPSYAIGRAPVSCTDYLAFIVATDHPTPAYWGGDDVPPALADHPVVGVSYDDARAYCRWLGTATGRSFRLPTEAEWEKAARGSDGRQYPWGDDWDPTACNTSEGGAGYVVASGSYPRNISPYGCVDMAGNVEEWISNRYQPYPGSPYPAPAHEKIVLRGGSWRLGPDVARCARRHGPYDGQVTDSIGFRVVCTDD